MHEYGYLWAGETCTQGSQLWQYGMSWLCIEKRMSNG